MQSASHDIPKSVEIDMYTECPNKKETSNLFISIFTNYKNLCDKAYDVLKTCANEISINLSTTTVHT